MPHQFALPQGPPPLALGEEEEAEAGHDGEVVEGKARERHDGAHSVASSMRGTVVVGGGTREPEVE